MPDDVEVKHPPFTFKDVRKNFKDRERSVLDEDGTVVPWQGANHPILFEVSGEGEFIGDSTIGANPVRAEGVLQVY